VASGECTSLSDRGNDVRGSSHSEAVSKLNLAVSALIPAFTEINHGLGDAFRRSEPEPFDDLHAPNRVESGSSFSAPFWKYRMASLQFLTTARPRGNALP
jgi:hypothetical protein